LEANLDNISLLGGIFPYKFIMNEGDDKGRLVDDEEVTVLGTSQFMLRAISRLAKIYNTKWVIWLATSILIYPETEEAMLALLPAVAHAAWRG
jgi:hypothetical protein